MKVSHLIHALTLSMCLAAAPAHAKTNLRFATSQVNPEEPIVKVMHSFADRVKERTGGELRLSIFTGDQLGPQKKVNEMVKSGGAILNVTDYGQLSQFVPDLGIMAGPYMYTNLDKARKLFESDVFADMAARLEAQGMKLIMVDGLFGYRHVIANKPVRKPDDMNGMTIRVPASPIMMETFAAIGARPTALPWSDVYNSLQSNVVDAAEANYGSLAGSKLYETRKVVSETGHQIMFAAFVTSKAFFDKLPKDQQQVLLEEGKAAGAELTRLTLESDQAYAELLKQHGVQIIKDVDVEAFAAKAIQAYDAVPGLTPGIVERARKAMGQ
jgi:tripartite ATP-independent transporter DctP family solute receptor